MNFNEKSGLFASIGVVAFLSACAMSQANGDGKDSGGASDTQEALGHETTRDSAATKTATTPAKPASIADKEKAAKAAAAAAKPKAVAKAARPNAVWKTPAVKAPSPAVAAAAPAAAPSLAPAVAVAATPTPASDTGSEKFIRFVTVDVLNVHSAPRLDAPVIAKVARGSMYTVSVNGDWAQLADGQFVQLRYLDKSPATQHKGHHLVSR